MQREVLTIGRITLNWSDWFSWKDVERDARSVGGVSVPKRSGVYEVKAPRSEKRLAIGKTTNLRHRIKQGLVRGTSPHSAGKRIRKNEDTSQLLIRWAETDRPACAEEELHRMYRKKHGQLPKYTRRT